MMQDTATYECQECHKELTFYQKTSDGYGCPICNGTNLLMVGKNKYRNREKVLETRKLYKKQLAEGNLKFDGKTVSAASIIFAAYNDCCE